MSRVRDDDDLAVKGCSQTSQGVCGAGIAGSADDDRAGRQELAEFTYEGFEYLERPADLADWLGAASLVTGQPQIDQAQLDEAQFDEAQFDQALLDDVLGLREAIDAGVRAAVTGQPFPAAALRELNAWLAAVPAQPSQLRISGGVAVLRSPASPRQPRQVIGDMALDAAEVLGTELRDRLRICPGPGCGGRFTDESPAGRRRWCSMAVCGNRNKAATHRVAVRD